MPVEPPQFPQVPHRIAGVDCTGSIVIEAAGDQVMLKCDECGAIVGSINSQILKALEQTISGQILVRKFDEMDAPEILTSISEECQRGDCESCPGLLHDSETGDEPIFCVHECHKVGDQGEGSVN